MDFTMKTWDFTWFNDLTIVKTINHGDFVMNNWGISRDQMIQVFMGHPSAFGLIDHQNWGFLSILTLSMSGSGPQGLLLKRGFIETWGLPKAYGNPTQNLRKTYGPFPLLCWRCGPLEDWDIFWDSTGLGWISWGFLEGVKGLRFGVLMKTCQ